MEDTYIHPSFPQPANASFSIWRYLALHKFRWMTEYGRLYMPSADQLGDPFEGTTPRGQRNWWLQLEDSAETDEKRAIYRHNRTFMSHFAATWRNHYYVTCWHMNPYESAAMWKLYTNSYEAVAIKSTYLSLRKELPKFAEMGMVRYIDYEIDRLPTLNLFEYIMHKNAYLSFECEVRAVAFQPVNDELGLSDFRINLFERESAPGVFVYAPPIDLQRVIQAVVLHPQAPAVVVAEVTEICDRLRLPAPEASQQTRIPCL